MWTSTVDFNLLSERGRWKVEFFCSPEKGDEEGLVEGLMPIRQLVRERKETVEPGRLGNAEINYLGLEHIQSLTGELVGFHPRPANSVKSRSKVFRRSDVLYGRLRPNLNKVWLAHEPAEGVCSTEFLVLIPNTKIILPIVLRYLLSSHYVQRHALRLQTGTALPRMDMEDLLDIRVPVPDMAVQGRIEAELNERFEELTALRYRLETLPISILDDFLCMVERS